MSGEENVDVRVLEEDSKDCFERYSLKRLLLPGGEIFFGETAFSSILHVIGLTLPSFENNARDNVAPDTGGEENDVSGMVSFMPYIAFAALL